MNSSYFVIQYLSIISSGHVAVLLDAQLKPIEHINNIISNNINVVIVNYFSKLKKALGPNSNIQVITQFCDLISEKYEAFCSKTYSKFNIPDNLAVIILLLAVQEQKGSYADT